jgi:hypothetical protein
MDSAWIDTLFTIGYAVGVVGLFWGFALLYEAYDERN